MFAQVGCAGDLDDLKQRVLDDGVSKTGGDIRNSSALLLGLFDIGVHEYGTAGAQVGRILCKERFFRKVDDRIV